MIRNVSPQAQQELAMAICECSPTNDRVILCHTPALPEPIDQCTLGTFDQFDECFEANMNVSLILPRPGLIHSIVKKHTGKVLTFHAVFHVNSHSGPIEVCVDLLQKAKQWYPNICRVQKSISISKRALLATLLQLPILLKFLCSPLIGF